MKTTNPAPASPSQTPRTTSSRALSRLWRALPTLIWLAALGFGVGVLIALS